MRLSDFTVEVRDAGLVRRGSIPDRDLDLKMTPRDRAAGDWQVVLPSDHPMAAWLRLPGSGLIVTHRDPAVGVMMSGPRRKPTDQATREDPAGTLTVTGDDDTSLLWRRLAYPQPGNAVVSTQVVAYDVRTGSAESVMHGYVGANLVAAAGAPAARAVAGLGLAANLNRGATVTKSARFDRLGDLLADIAGYAGLGFRVVQIGQGLQFQVVDPGDVSGFVRLDLWNGTLSGVTVTDDPPSVSRVIVAGQGQGDQRTFLERSNPAAETGWGPFGRTEVYLDQRQTDDPVELAQAGDKALADGAGSASMTAIPGDDSTMAWPQNWDVGDTVTVVSEGDEYPAQVTSVTLIANREGIRVAAGIGDVQGWTPQSAVEAAQAATEARVSALERNAEVDSRGGRLAGEVIPWAGIGIPVGWLLCDGSAVSRTQYADLFAAIGTQFGTGNGSTTFALPQLAGRFPMGAFGATYPVGGAGGAATHTLTQQEMPSHTHTQTSHAHNYNAPQYKNVVVQSGSGNTAMWGGPNVAEATIGIAPAIQATGGGLPHNNMPPYTVLRFLIRT